MIGIANACADQLVEKQLIAENDCDIYLYGLQSITTILTPPVRRHNGACLSHEKCENACKSKNEASVLNTTIS